MADCTEVVRSNNGSVIAVLKPPVPPKFILSTPQGGQRAGPQAPYLSFGCDLSLLVTAYMREFFYWLI
jgi:hypothetical protein